MPKPYSDTHTSPFRHFAGCLAVALILIAATAYGQTGYEVREVAFEGNTTFGDDRLNDITAAYGAGWIVRTFFGKDPFTYDEETINADIRRLTKFYQRYGYLYVDVSAELRDVNHDDESLSLTFNIDERAPIAVDTVTYRFSDTSAAPQSTRDEMYSRFGPELLMQPGERFRDDAIQNDQRRIVNTYRHVGYAYITAIPQLDVDTTSNTVAVTWQIDTGPRCEFGEITIEGNGVIARDVVLTQMEVVPGAVYDTDALNESQRQIYNLGVFQVATVSSQLSDDHDRIIPVRVQLKTAPIWDVRFGGGWGREDGIRAFTDFRLLDVLGGARRLDLNLRHSDLEPYSASITLTQPAFLTPKTSGSINPFVRRQEEPGFTANRWGARLSLSHTFNDFLNASITYTLERIELDTAAVSDEVAQDRDIDDLYNRSSITAATTWDNSRPLFSPQHGWFVGTVFKVAGLGFGSQYQYIRPILDVRHYRPFLGMTLALRSRIGTVESWAGNNFIPIEDRLFSGGSNSIRGWGRSELGPVDSEGKPIGGNSLLEAASELRYPIYGDFSGVVFFEGGNVWRDAVSYTLSDLRYAAGFGFRYSTPVGPARLDLAQPVFDEEKTIQYHLSVGQAF